MRRLSLLFLSMAFVSQTAFSEPLPKVRLDVNDKASLQTGAEYFMNYCHSCHSLEFQRYNITGRDIGLETDDELKTKLIHTGSYSTREGEFQETKVGEQMLSAMNKKDATYWFGTPPPDLSTIIRAKGADYIYAYLNTFYMDEARPLGVNNATFDGVGMPHVLMDLQGAYRATTETKLPAGCTAANNDDCKATTVITGTELATPGLMTETEYRAVTNDLTNFLAYVSEPAQIKRAQYGPWVLGFLIIFTFFAYLLNREYWKDVK